MILVTQRGLDRDAKLAQRIDAAVFPGLQGGPHNATTAAIAIAAEEASRPEFSQYGLQIRKNATALASELMEQGIKLVGSGTETHLMVLDFSRFGKGLGTQVAFALDVAGIYANKNTVPNEPMSPMFPSGLRIGTPLITTRGMKEAEMKKIAGWIARAVQHVSAQQLPTDPKLRSAFLSEFRHATEKDQVLLEIAEEVKSVTAKFPLFRW
jgi:glycine hydroxymethyltransferase